MTGVVDAIYRYPVKGLSAERLDGARLEAGEVLPFDRAYAIENGPSRFDPYRPSHVPSTGFLTLARHARLAELETTFDVASTLLTISRDDRRVVAGDLSTQAGRAIVAQFFAEFMRGDLRGPPRVVSAEGHSFTDIPEKALRIVNAESIRDLERATEMPIDQRRFRANIVLSGISAWVEDTWPGSTLEIGDVRLAIMRRIEDCTTANVDPATGARDLDVPAALKRLRGHDGFGIYAAVVGGGEIRRGSPVTLSRSAGQRQLTAV